MTLAIDAFSGGGGATIAMRSLGLDVVGFELNADACASHHAAGHRTVRTDLRTYPWGHLAGRIDVFHASPPCQPFSAGGNHAGQLDPRDGVPWTLRAVAELRPRLVTVENVKGLTFRKHTSYLAWFLESLRDLGYTVDHRVLNAADFGVPQTRERLFVIARNDGVLPKWPDPTHTREQWVSMAAALGWSDDLALNTGRDLRDSGGRASAQMIPLDDPAPTVSAVLGQWWLMRPATTVQGDTRVWAPGHKINADDVAHGRSGQDRAGSRAVRVDLHELAVLQGFPPDYPFVGTRTSRARQIGNAVPPQLLAAVLGANLEEVPVTVTEEVLLDDLVAGERPPMRRRPGEFRRHPLTGAPYVYNVDGELTADGKRVRSEMYKRASSMGENLASRFALERRDHRMLVIGLRLMIERGEVLGDDVDEIVGRALRFAGAWLAAERGTALHSLWEDPDAPLDYDALGLCPELMEACRLAIERCLERHGLEVLAHELTIVNDLLRAAGTADAFCLCTRDLVFADGVLIPSGSVVVVDLKSGVLRIEAGRPRYWTSYSVQLAVYAGGCRYIIDADDSERREPFPWNVSQAYGLILHVGIEAALDTDVATAQLWRCDLVTGRRGGDLVLDMGDWAKQRPFAELTAAPVAVTVETDGPSKLEVLLEQSLALVSEGDDQAGDGDGDEGDRLDRDECPVDEVGADAQVDEPLVGHDGLGLGLGDDHDPTVDDTEYGVDIYRAWMQDRIDVIGKHSVEARRQLQVRWPAGIPPLRRSNEHTDAELAAIESCLDDVEAACSLPFGPTKPGTARPADGDGWLSQLVGAFPGSITHSKGPTS